MFPSLYAILDADLLGTNLLPCAAKLADAGVQLMQLRAKHATPRRLHGQARELLERVSPRGVRLVLDDRPDIAAMAGVAGVHVGQDDLPVEEARQICKPPLWVGVSTHNIEQFREAAPSSADYIAVGPIFPTSTKENPDPVTGIGLLRAVRSLTRKPLVAIGGITAERAAEVFRAGADSLAVIRDLAAGPDPAARARQYLEIAEAVRSERS